MAGNYDYPRAGNPSRLSPPSAPPDRRPEITARLRHLRELLDSDRQRDRQRLAIETLDSELLHMSAEPISSRLERRRRGLEAQLGVQPSDLSHDSTESTTSAPGSGVMMRSRRRPVRPSERLQRFREQSGSPGPSELESIRSRSRLMDPASTLSPLGERPPRIGSPDLLSQEYSGEAQVNFENRWRAKRRKLDSDDTGNMYKGFKYGHYGQVVPGQLKMELDSCDGGQYSESNGDSSLPEHVLLDDSSVYCTKSDRCNMILRHQGETPFCLKKIVIKAPKSGFDAAIQEGMIFVSMERDDLLARTSSYRIQYSPRQSSRRAEQGQIRLPPSAEYFNSVRSPLRSLEETPTSLSSRQNGTHYHTLAESSDREESHPSVSRVPGFRVTTDYDDKSDDGFEDDDSENVDSAMAPEVAYERLRSLHDLALSQYRDRPRHSHHLDTEEDDSSGDEGGWDENLVASDLEDSSGARYIASVLRNARSLGQYINRRRHMPSLIQLVPILKDPSTFGTWAEGDSRSEPLIPHATFFIQRDKDLVAIKFDPPVSGKFILIKLWAPSADANIDIQSIIAHGYAGTRYFPAITAR